MNIFISLVVYVLIAVGGVMGCTFPEFLRQPLANGEGVWLTELRYSPATGQWEEDVEMRVNETEITASRHYTSTCHSAASSSHCHYRDVIYTRRCLIQSQSDSDVFIVREQDVGRTTYLCMKFTLRTRNVVQIWTGPAKESFNVRLCDESLERNIWPWFAPVQVQWVPCPLIGGFVVSSSFKQQKAHCVDQWLAVTIESECMPGDGLIFHRHGNATCFLGNVIKPEHLVCWAFWQESDFTFVVLAEVRRPLIKYTLRLASNSLNSATIEATFTQGSHVALTLNSTPAELHTLSHDIVLRRKAPGLCQDESDQCRQLARQGKCADVDHVTQARHCRLSCGLCNMLPPTRAECHLPDGFHGDWLLFDNDRVERVVIANGHVTMTSFGTLVCKRKHWQENYFRMLSYASNGCRHRYTCLQLNMVSHSELNLRISKSTESDTSFEMCQFNDDLPPLGPTYHSAAYKLLYSSKVTSLDSCGLEGEIGVVLSAANGIAGDDITTCDGHMSDWSAVTCSHQPVLHLTLDGSCALQKTDASKVLREFYQCVAFVSVSEDVSMLITSHDEQNRGSRLNCWLITTSQSERSSYRRWRVAYLLSEAQCSEDLLVSLPPKSTLLTVTISDGIVRRPCNDPKYHDKMPSTHNVKVTASSRNSNSHVKSHYADQTADDLDLDLDSKVHQGNNDAWNEDEYVDENEKYVNDDTSVNGLHLYRGHGHQNAYVDDISSNVRRMTSSALASRYRTLNSSSAYSHLSAIFVALCCVLLLK